jgi:hypothetical protein
LSKANATSDILLPEIVEAIRQEGARVDVNVLLIQLVKRVADPDDIVGQSEKLLEVAQKFEDHRVANFQKMANAIIDVKERDPDELEKRRNNRVRRALKGVVGSCAVTAVIGAGLSVWLGGGIVVTGLLVAIAAVSLAMSGPLASGESMSPNDAVRIVHAVRGWIPPAGEKGAQEETTRKRRGRGR